VCRIRIGGPSAIPLISATTANQSIPDFGTSGLSSQMPVASFSIDGHPIPPVSVTVLRQKCAVLHRRILTPEQYCCQQRMTRKLCPRGDPQFQFGLQLLRRHRNAIDEINDDLYIRPLSSLVFVGFLDPRQCGERHRRGNRLAVVFENAGVPVAGVLAEGR